MCKTRHSGVLSIADEENSKRFCDACCALLDVHKLSKESVSLKFSRNMFIVFDVAREATIRGN